MANEFFINEYTSEVQKLVFEVVQDPTTFRGQKYIPAQNLPVNKIRCEVIEASGGATTEHLVGTQPKNIQTSGSRTQEFAPGAYQEKILYNETDILYLRELGQNDPSKRGIRQKMNIDIDRLNRRLETRMELLRWQAIFNGSFTYFGRVFSYGIPTANRAVPVGAAWSADAGVTPNNTANPIADIRYWCLGAYAPFRKYKIRSLVMNAVTARLILENTNTKQYLSSIGANPNISEWSIEKLISFLIPGGPIAEIYNGWYQEETVTSGRITVGDAIYFIPDGYIFFECELPGGDKIGELTLGLHLASGTIDSPGYGKFIVPEENIAPGTKGGPSNPYIEVHGGFRGGVNLQRSFDVLTAYVF